MSACRDVVLRLPFTCTENHSRRPDESITYPVSADTSDTVPVFACTRPVRLHSRFFSVPFVQDTGSSASSDGPMADVPRPRVVPSSWSAFLLSSCDRPLPSYATPRSPPTAPTSVRTTCRPCRVEPSPSEAPTSLSSISAQVLTESCSVVVPRVDSGCDDTVASVCRIPTGRPTCSPPYTVTPCAFSHALTIDRFPESGS